MNPTPFLRYGQRHERELGRAQDRKVARRERSHRIARIDLRIFAGSALTAEIESAESAPAPEMARAASQSPLRTGAGHDFSLLTPWPLGRGALESDAG